VTILEHFANLFGGRVKFVRKFRNHKPQYHYILRGRDFLKLHRKLSPFLIEKRGQANCLYLAYHYTKKENKIILHEVIEQLRKENMAVPEDKERIEARSRSVIPSEMDFAYLAGFIDAECSLSLQRYKIPKRNNWIYKPILQCNNTKTPTLSWAVERFGGQIYFIKRNHKENHNDQISWRLSSESLNNILPKILPFLHAKKPICEELIKFSKTILPLKNTISRHSPKFEEFYAPILEERSLIFEAVRHLNRKGS
jgi:hypothetical protein